MAQQDSFPTGLTAWTLKEDGVEKILLTDDWKVILCNECPCDKPGKLTISGTLRHTFFFYYTPDLPPGHRDYVPLPTGLEATPDQLFNKGMLSIEGDSSVDTAQDPEALAISTSSTKISYALWTHQQSKAISYIYSTPLWYWFPAFIPISDLIEQTPVNNLASYALDAVFTLELHGRFDRNYTPSATRFRAVYEGHPIPFASRTIEYDGSMDSATVTQQNPSVIFTPD